MPFKLALRRLAEASVLLAAFVSVMVAGCGSGIAQTTFGGSVTGLGIGNSMVLQLQHPASAASATISASGVFVIEKLSLSAPIPYSLFVASQPLGQTCSVATGTGIANPGTIIDNMLVDCSGSTHNVSATVSGITANPNSGLVLQNNGGDSIAVFINGVALNFNTPLPASSVYSVTVLAQPVGQTCTVINGSGVTASANVNVAVNCI